MFKFFITQLLTPLEKILMKKERKKEKDFMRTFINHNYFMGSLNWMQFIDDGETATRALENPSEDEWL